MKLLTKPIVKKAMEQFKKGSDMNQMVVAKFFDPVGDWKWYLINMEDEEGDYCWGIVKGFAVEVGSFSVPELKSVKLAWGQKIERDLYFKPMKAAEVFEGLKEGEWI